MKNHRITKKIAAISVAFLLIYALTGCGGNDGKNAQKYLSTWIEQADLESEDTPEQLYQAALKEGTLVIYSATTRIYKVKESFEAKYPGLFVEVYDMRAHDIIKTLQNAYEKQEWLCDIVICSDDNAVLSSELLASHIVNKYVPHDIAPFLQDSVNQGLLSFVGEAEQLFYNTKVYSECPVKNWWELTEPQWNGKIYMNSPLRSLPAYALVHSVIANSGKMAEAYEQLYGKALEIPAGSNAGEVFWDKLVHNGMRFTTSSNELVELVGAPNQDDPPLAFMISSKIRQRDVGMPIAAAYGVAPCDGVCTFNNISIAGGAKNVNAAKLFIRWILGEADGTGQGLKPYTSEGTWPVRTDVACPSEVSLDEGAFWFNDKARVVAMDRDIMSFWQELQAQAESQE